MTTLNKAQLAATINAFLEAYDVEPWEYDISHGGSLVMLGLTESTGDVDMHLDDTEFDRLATDPTKIVDLGKGVFLYPITDTIDIHKGTRTNVHYRNLHDEETGVVYRGAHQSVYDYRQLGRDKDLVKIDMLMKHIAVQVSSGNINHECLIDMTIWETAIWNAAPVEMYLVALNTVKRTLNTVELSGKTCNDKVVKVTGTRDGSNWNFIARDGYCTDTVLGSWAAPNIHVNPVANLEFTVEAFFEGDAKEVALIADVEQNEFIGTAVWEAVAYDVIITTIRGRWMMLFTERSSSKYNYIWELHAPHVEKQLEQMNTDDFSVYEL